jgi:hypothetical protein
LSARLGAVRELRHTTHGRPEHVKPQRPLTPLIRTGTEHRSRYATPLWLLAAIIAVVLEGIVLITH